MCALEYLVIFWYVIFSRLHCYVFGTYMLTNRNPNVNKLSWAINYVILCYVLMHFIESYVLGCLDEESIIEV